MVAPSGSFHVSIGSQAVDLPIVGLAEDLAVALMITVDLGIDFVGRCAAELAEMLSPSMPDVVVTAATLGIPVGIEVTRALGLDDFVVLHKTPKIHLSDALVEPVRSITTGPPQLLRLDTARLAAVRSKRAVFVDDVISTGSSAAAAVRLLRRAGASVVGIGALATETRVWEQALGDDAELVRRLTTLPVFRPAPGGGFTEDWDG